MKPDYAMRFEKAISRYIKTDGPVTFTKHWPSDFARKSLLYAACIVRYDEGGTDRDIVFNYMEQLEKEEFPDVDFHVQVVDYLNGN